MVALPWPPVQRQSIDGSIDVIALRSDSARKRDMAHKVSSSYRSSP